MSNINDNIIDTINSQILHGNRTLNLISQSYTLINSQQQNLYLLTRLLQSNLNNNNSTNNNNNSTNNNSTNTNNNISSTNPFSIIINDISVTDISGSNIELNNMLYSSLMNLLSDTSLNITNDDSNNIVDISSVTIIKKFSDIDNPTYTNCSITLEQFNENDEVLEIINCKHYFNCDALKTWLATNNICPVCRQSVE